MIELNGLSLLWSKRLAYATESRTVIADQENIVPQLSGATQTPGFHHVSAISVPEESGPNCCWVLCDLCCWVQC
jgi:hypothetical protein